MYRNLPNLLTIFRLILVPFVARALWLRGYRSTLVLLCLAGATDALDGYLARRFDWTSRFGAYMDPVGDKVLLVSVYLVLGLRGVVPLWLTGLVLGRDALILGMVAFAFLFTPVRAFPPSLWGKISTVVQVMGALAIIAGYAFSAAGALWWKPSVIDAIAVATVISGIHYAWTASVRFGQLRAKSVSR